MYILLIPISIMVDHGYISFWEGLIIFFVAYLCIRAIVPQEKH